MTMFSGGERERERGEGDCNSIVEVERGIEKKEKEGEFFATVEFLGRTRGGM